MPGHAFIIQPLNQVIMKPPPLKLSSGPGLPVVNIAPFRLKVFTQKTTILKLGVIFTVLLIVALSCKDNEAEIGGCPMFDIVPSPPYDDPIWHPSGEIIGFNHIPIKEIHYTYGYDCPRQARYIYDEDSVGFWLINADGTNQRRALPYSLLTPAWSPDGKWIAFSQGAQLHKMPFDGSRFDTTAIVQLTFEGRNFFPAWSPDGKWIAYNESICDDIKSCGIWITNLESGTHELIGTYGNYPSWHPYNDSLIYLTNHLDKNNTDIGDIIWLYKNMSKTKHLLISIASPNYDNRYPKYSPDGTKIAFISALNTGEGTHLYTINPDGSGLNRLTTSGTLNFSWSPNGKIVYLNFDYSRIDETQGTLWVMDADGSNKQQLTYNSFQLIQ